MTTCSVLPSVPYDAVGPPNSIFLSRLNTQPTRCPVNASPLPSRTATHDSGPTWFATPWLGGTCTRETYRFVPAHRLVKILERPAGQQFAPFQGPFEIRHQGKENLLLFPASDQYLSPSARCSPVNGLAGCYVSTIGKPHENFDLTRCSGRTPNRPAHQSWVCLCFWTRREWRVQGSRNLRRTMKMWDVAAISSAREAAPHARCGFLQRRCSLTQGSRYWGVSSSVDDDGALRISDRALP